MSEKENVRISEATWKLEDAEARLRKACDGSVPFPASSHLATALLHIIEAQSKLRGGP